MANLLKHEEPQICPDCNRSYDEHDGECYPAKSKREDRERALQVVDLLSRYVNQGRSPQAIVEAMSYEHRTLQQQVTVVCLQWLLHLANLPQNNYDLRNEASVRIAKALLPVLVENNVVISRRNTMEAHLPFI